MNSTRIKRKHATVEQLLVFLAIGVERQKDSDLVIGNMRQEEGSRMMFFGTCLSGGVKVWMGIYRDSGTGYSACEGWSSKDQVNES